MDKGVMHNGVSCPRVDPKLTTTGIPGALEDVRQFAAPRIAKRKPAEAHSQMIDLKNKKCQMQFKTKRYLCSYIHIHVYTNMNLVYIHLYTSSYIHTSPSIIHIYTGIYVYIYIHLCIKTCAHVHICVCLCRLFM
jgi:hypothetical protein